MIEGRRGADARDIQPGRRPLPQALTAQLAGVTIDVLVHNAGSINATREIEGGAMFGEQALKPRATVTPSSGNPAMVSVTT